MQNSVGRPKRKDKDNLIVASSEKGTKPGEMRKTYIVRKDLVSKIEMIAHNRSIKDNRLVSVKSIVNDALQIVVDSYERLHGPLA